MTKEQEEAIEGLKSLSPSENDIDTVLNMLKETSAESAEKDKIIAEKSAEIEKLKTDFKIVDQECSRLEKKEAKQDKMIDLMAEELKKHIFILSDGSTITSKKGIIKHYERKATNDD